MANFFLGAPLAYMYATEGYGMTRSADTGGTRLHGGVDLRAPVGTPVFAASDGSVVFGGQYNDGSGGAVELNHLDGVVTRYLHLSRVDVSSGATVKKGQQLGLTGYAVSPHLHWDTWVSPSILGEYTGKFGQPVGMGSETKMFQGRNYTKVPSEPLAPMSYQDDVLAAAKNYSVSLYNPILRILQPIPLAIVGLGGYLLYKYIA